MADLGPTIEALKNDPASKEAASELRKRAREDGDLRAYADAFAERGRALLAKGLIDDAISSFIEAAQVCEEDLEDAETAAALYSKVLDIRGDHRRALFALGLLLHDLGRFEDLIDLYRRRLALTKDEGETTTLYLYIAEILSERLGNQHRAFQEVMKAARLAPRNLRIIDRLEALGDRTNRLDEVAVVIGDLILHQSDPQVRAALSVRLGQLQMGRLGSPERALACFRGALVDDGGNPEILGSLDELFRAQERFGQLAELLEELTRDRRTAPHQLRLYRELARIYDRELGDHKRALAAVVRAAKISSDDRETLDEVLRLGLAAGELETVAATFGEAANQATNPLLRTYLRLKLGHLLGVVLDRPDEAAEAYRAILAQDPDHKEARRRLAKIYEGQKRWTRLVLLLEEEADRAGSIDDELETLRRIQDVQRAHLEDDQGLRARIERRLQEVGAEAAESKAAPPPARPEPALRAVRPAEPFAQIPAARTGVNSTEPTELAGDAGHKRETEAGRPLSALPSGEPFDSIEVDEIVGAIDGGAFLTPDEPSAREEPRGVSELTVPGSRRPEGTSELEAFPPPPNFKPATSVAPPDTSHPIHVVFQTEEVPAAAIFPVVRGERISEVPPPISSVPSGVVAPAEWPPRDPGLELVEIPPSDQVVPRSPGAGPPRPSQAPNVARIKVARVPVQAARPSAPPARSSDAPAPRASVPAPKRPSAAPRPAVRTSVPPSAKPSVPPPDAEPRLEELARALADATRRVDVQAQIELLEEIVALHSDRGEADRALVAAMRLVRLSPNEERVRRLLALSARAEAEAAVLELYDEVQTRLDLDAQIRLGVLVADMESGALDRKAEAVIRLRRLFELAPDAVEVFERLTRLLLELRALRDLATLLEGEGRKSNDPFRAKELLLEAARVKEIELSDSNGAANAMLTFVERFPDDLSARSEVVRLLDASGRFEDEAYFLESDVYARPVSERPSVRRRLAHLQLERLGRPEAAERILRQALAEDPDDGSSLRMLIEILEREAAWPSLVDALGTLVELMSSAPLRVEMRKKLAEVAEKRLKRADLAAAALAAAIEDAPADLEALTSLERLERASRSWDEVSRLIELRARAQEEPRDRARVLLEVAELRAQELGDEAGAARALKSAAALSPNDPEVLRALADHTERTRDAASAIEALHDLVIVVEAEERPPIHLRIAKILEEQLGQSDEAAVELELVLDSRPVDRDALGSLVRIKRSLGDHASAAAYEERLAAVTEDPRERARLFMSAASSYRSAGDSDAAVRSLEAAAEAVPNDPQILADLGRQNLSAGRSVSAIATLGAAAKLLEKSDLARAVELHIGAAEAAERALRFGEAKKHYEDALALVPMARKALARLAVLLESAGDPSRAFELSAALLLHHEDALSVEERKEAYVRMAKSKRASGEPEAAARFAQNALDAAEDDADALSILAAAFFESGRPDAAAETFERLAKVARDEETRRSCIIQAARLCLDAAKNPARAAQLLGELFSRAPQDQEVAEMLARAAERAGDPKRAAYALSEAARTAEPEARVELLLRAAGRIVAHDRTLAKTWLAEGLAEAPTDPAAFSTLASLLENDRDLVALAELHERTGTACLAELERAKSTEATQKLRAQARTHLDHAIELFRHHIGRPESALLLLDRRRSLESANEDDHWLEARAELLDEAANEGGPGGEAKKRQALETWAVLLERQPGHVTALRRLFALSTELRQPRTAQLFAEILVALDEATKEEKRLFEVDRRFDPPPPAAARNVEIPSLWDDGPLFDLLKELGHAPLTALQDALPEPRPKKRDRLEVSTLDPAIARSFFDASAILGKELPAIYTRPDGVELITPSWVEGHPAFIVTPALLEKETGAALRFEIAHALTILSPRFLAVSTLPIEVLREAIEGLVRDRLSDEVLYADAKRAKKRGKALEKSLPEERREWIMTRAEKWLRDPHRASLTRARELAERNAERAGLVASGSVFVATETLEPKDRRWFFPLVEFACTRLFASIAGRHG